MAGVICAAVYRALTRGLTAVLPGITAFCRCYAPPLATSTVGRAQAIIENRTLKDRPPTVESVNALCLSGRVPVFRARGGFVLVKGVRYKAPITGEEVISRVLVALAEADRSNGLRIAVPGLRVGVRGKAVAFGVIRMEAGQDAVV